MEIPLLSLPVFALFIVFNELSICDLLNLSVCSKKTKKMIRAAKLRAEFVNVSFEGRDGNHLIVKYKGNGHMIQVRKTRNVEQFGKLRPDTDTLSDYYHPEPDEGLQELYIRFLDIIPMDYTKKFFSTNRHRMDFSKMSDSIKESFYLQISTPRLTKTDIELLFQHFPNSMDLQVTKKLPRNYLFEGRQLKHLHLHGENVFKPLDLLKMDVKEFTLLNSKFKTSDMNMLIKKWLEDSGKPSLTSVIAQEFTPEEQFVFLGIKHSSWDSKVRSQFYVWQHNMFGPQILDCQYGQDIRRDDGLLATVLCYVGSIYFVVWHERFHKMPNFHGEIVVTHQNGYNNGTNGKSYSDNV